MFSVQFVFGSHVIVITSRCGKGRWHLFYKIQLGSQSISVLVKGGKVHLFRGTNGKSSNFEGNKNNSEEKHCLILSSPDPKAPG